MKEKDKKINPHQLRRVYEKSLQQPQAPAFRSATTKNEKVESERS